MRLYSPQGERLYINASERICFEKMARKQPERIKLFCLILLYTGCRVSEAINLTRRDFQLTESIVSINSLKKRDEHHMREIPVPKHLIKAVEAYLAVAHEHPQYQPWNIHRGTAWDWVKAVMKEANIVGNGTIQIHNELQFLCKDRRLNRITTAMR